MADKPRGRQPTLQRYQELLEINRLMTSSLDREAILQVVVERATRLLDGAAAVLLLLERQGEVDSLRVVAAYNAPPDCSVGRRVLLRPDAMAAIRGLHPGVEPDAFVGVPMLLREETVGILAVYCRYAYHTDPEDEYLLTALADQAAIAIENARLYKQATRAEYLQTVLASIPDPVYVTDRTGVVVLTNQAGLGLFGVKTMAELTRPLVDMVAHYEVLDDAGRELKAEEMAARLGALGEAFDAMSIRLRDPRSEQQRWIIVAGSPLRDGQGQVAGSVIAVKDITPVKKVQTERELLLTEVQRRERLLHSVMESAQDAIICADSGGSITAWNRGAEVMLGYSADEVIGKPLSLLMSEADGAAHHQILTRAAATGRAATMGRLVEGNARRKDGSELSVEITTALWRADDENFVTGVVRDISVRKLEQAEHAQLAATIERERTTLSAVISSLSDGLLVLDAEARVRYCNAQAGELLGVDPAATIDRHVGVAFRALESPARLRAALEALERAPVGSSDDLSFEITGAGTDQRDLAISLFRVADISGVDQGTGLLVRDITASRAVARLEERERFAMDLHDGVIQSLYGVALGLATQERKLSKADGDTAESLRRARLRISGIIQDVRNYISDLRLHELGERGLSRGLETLSEELRINAAIFAKLDVDPDLDSLVEPDVTYRVLQIVREVTSNVIRHAGGTTVAIHARRTDGQLTLRIVDDGRGFDPAKAGRSGGQGLPNMAERARGLGANLIVTSQLGQGTEVLLELPLRMKAQEPPVSELSGDGA